MWIGMNSIILKGVTIGRGAIIAASSVVVRDVEAGCLYAGNPARRIKHLDPNQDRSILNADPARDRSVACSWK